jgi:hypothetical protein
VGHRGDLLVNFPDIPASHGDILVRSATAWGAVPGTTIGAHPLVPDLRNRILRIKDGAGNDLEIHQVWIPKFDSEGFTHPNLNGIECGGFWIDKYQACMHDASNVSRGSSTVNDPGTHGAASMPGVVIWTDINWTNAKIAIENRGGARTRQQAPVPRSAPSPIKVLRRRDHAPDRARVRITQDDVTYVRRIVKTGGDTTQTQTPRNSSRSIRHSRRRSRATTPTRSSAISYPGDMSGSASPRGR